MAGGRVRRHPWRNSTNDGDVFYVAACWVLGCGVRGVAALTVRTRPERRCPFKRSTMDFRSDASSISTNPNPRECPVMRSRMTWANVTEWPCSSSHCRNSASPQACGMFPTNNLNIPLISSHYQISNGIEPCIKGQLVSPGRNSVGFQGDNANRRREWPGLLPCRQRLRSRRQSPRPFLRPQWRQ